MDDDWELEAAQTEAQAAQLLRAKETTVKKTAAAAAAPAAKATDSSAAGAAGRAARKGVLDDLTYEESEDPAERRRQREAVENAANMMAAADLFAAGGADEDAVRAAVDKVKPAKLVKMIAPTPSSQPGDLAVGGGGNSLRFQTVQDCRAAVDILDGMISASQPKSVALLELLLGLLRVCAFRMDEKDLKTVSDRAKSIKADLAKEKRLAAQSGRKIYENSKDKIKNYKDELNIFYGTGGGDDEEDADSEEEEDDDYFM